MTLIDDIRRNSEAGTPGPWEYARDGAGDFFVTRPDGQHIIEISGGDDQSEPDTRRVVCVPDMEAALLAAEELAAALVVQHEVFGLTPECVKALAAYRAAVEGK